ncbi:hypothetical protein GOBAR_AA28528 [Gossypium barbadense]|uniref:Pentatricopeptide repeat-containing protein n=1 Tax=Gossypium barbadense TaxID=3634 RepID=A0A2P5WM31_GOSBA|nr:hypothetical protein GOBAR_AA28528 [Gossypium barbadense]
MQGNGVLADNFTYPFLLKACDSLELVKMIHTLIEKNGFLSDIFVPNALIDSYSKFGELGIKAALKLFTIMEDRDIVTWNSMIAGLLKEKWKKLLNCFKRCLRGMLCLGQRWLWVIARLGIWTWLEF